MRMREVLGGARWGLPVSIAAVALVAIGCSSNEDSSSANTAGAGGAGANGGSAGSAGAAAASGSSGTSPGGNAGSAGTGGTGGTAGSGGANARCAEDIPEGTCPDGRRCDQGACIVDNLNTEPLAASIDPVASFNEIWALYDKNYGAFSVKSVDWNEVKTRYAQEAATVTTRGELYWLVNRAVAEIGDGHSYAIHPDMVVEPQFYYSITNTGLCAVAADDGAIVVYAKGTVAPAQIARGDEVLGFDDRTISEALFDLSRQPRGYTSASTSDELRDRLIATLFYRANTDQTVLVKHENGTTENVALTVSNASADLLKCNGVIGPPGPRIDRGNGVVTATLDGPSPLLYISFPYFGSYDDQGNFVDQPIIGTLREVFTEAVANGVTGIAIDLRGNAGGSPNVYLAIASYLFDTSTDLFQCKNRNPSGGHDTYFAPYALTAEPDASLHFAGKVAVLVGSQSFSAADFTSYFLQSTGRARLFGHPSGGGFGNGNVIAYPDDAKWVLGANNALCSSLDGAPLEGAPPAVDTPVAYTRADIAASKDTVIEAARQWLSTP